MQLDINLKSVNIYEDIGNINPYPDGSDQSLPLI